MQDNPKRTPQKHDDSATAKQIMTQAINDTKSMRISMGSAVVNKLSKQEAK